MRTRRRHGATIAEIIEVLKLCVVQGMQACNLGVPILAKELANRSALKVNGQSRDLVLENDRFRESIRTRRQIQRMKNLRFSKTSLETIFSK
jgi:hypothetical protein